MTRNLLVLLFLGLIASAAPALAVEATVMFAVDKMNCKLCPITVRKAMEGVDGVVDAKVDYDNKTATVTFDNERTTPDEIAKASTDIGYPATLARE
jgi:periplasmic mercuric ion binding protein